MTVLDDKLVPLVFVLAQKYGKDFTFTIGSTPSYDVSTGIQTSTTTTSVVRCTPPDRYDLQYINGDNIKFGDVRIYVPAQGLTFTPYRGQTVTFDGKNWTILEVHPLYSGDLACMYEVQLRQ